MCFMFRQKINNKSRYNGCHMTTYGAILPGTVSLARIPAGLSKEAKKRVGWFDYYRECGNVAKTCRRFGISRNTFHKWKRRYSPYLLSSLEDQSRRPRRVHATRAHLSGKASAYTVSLLFQIQTRRYHETGPGNAHIRLHGRKNHQEVSALFQTEVSSKEKTVCGEASHRTAASAEGLCDYGAR